MNFENSNIYFLNLSPSPNIQELLSTKMNQFLDLLPFESQAKVFIKKAKTGIAYQGYIFLNTIWGKMHVTDNDSCIEDLMEKIGSRLQSEVRAKRKIISLDGHAETDFEATAEIDTEEAVRSILEREELLSCGG